MDLLAISTQLAIVDGAILDEKAVPGLLAQPAPSKAARGRERDFLFVHLALTGRMEESANLSADLVEELSRRFFAQSGSITAALRDAVIAINEQLLHHNMAHKTSFEGALSCAVLRSSGQHSQIYSLQVGEGLAFMGHNFGVERLPPTQPDHITPLGRSVGIDIRFSFHRLQNGDMMLLADPRLAWLNGESLAPVLVDTEIETGLEALLDLMKDGSAAGTAKLLLVEFVDELPSTLPLTFQHSRQSAAKPGEKKGGGAKETTGTERPIREAVAPAPIRTEGSYGAARGETEQVGNASDPTNAARAVEVEARRVASSSARGLSRFTAWIADIISRLTREKEEDSRVPRAIPTAVALLIPIIMASVMTGVYIQRDTVADLSRIKGEMVAELSAAEAAESGSLEAQDHYLRALTLAIAAEALREGDPEVVTMRSQIYDTLDRLDGVTRLAAITLYRYGDDANLTRMALREGSGGIAVLNQAANQVLFHNSDARFQALANEAPAVLTFEGKSVGNQIVGTIFDILWVPGDTYETRDTIHMADRSGSLFSYFPSLMDIRAAKLGNSSEWIEPVALGYYSGRLYVLDSGASIIRKYYESKGFAQVDTDQYINLPADADLKSAIDFDIFAEDATLVILYDDGRIRSYNTRKKEVIWDEATLRQNGMSIPFIAPSSIKFVGTGLNTSIFVLDPGSGRLVQLSRSGVPLAQYRILNDKGENLLPQASDFAIVDSPLRILFVAGDQILLAQR